MPIRINGSNIQQARINGNNIQQFKINGEIFSLTSLILSFANKVLSASGTEKVDIYYANNSEILEDYDKICTLENENYNYFNDLNFAPSEANKIVACTYKTQNIIAECSIPADFKKEDLGTKLYSIGLLSDVHIDGDGTDEASASSDFVRALEYFNNKVSAVCISGDLCCENGYNELATFKNLVDNNANVPVYASRGNHDTRYPISDWNTIGYQLYEEKTINNEHYLFLGMNAENYGDNCFTTEELDWLEQKLETYKNQRTYLFFHVFMPDTCGNINNLYPWDDLDASASNVQRFLNLMSKYKNAVYFSGHSHLEFGCQKFGANANVFSNGSTCHRVHIPSCAKPRKNPDGSTSSNTYTNDAGSEGYIMDVYENYIVLKGIDFTKLKILPIANYIINTTPVAIEENEGLWGNATIIDGYISSSSSRYVAYLGGDKIGYISCKPNTTYKITRQSAGIRFRAAYTNVIPQDGNLLNGLITNDTATEINITTDGNAKYLLVYYWTLNDSKTDYQRRSEINIVEV